MNMYMYTSYYIHVHIYVHLHVYAHVQCICISCTHAVLPPPPLSLPVFQLLALDDMAINTNIDLVESTRDSDMKVLYMCSTYMYMYMLVYVQLYCTCTYKYVYTYMYMYMYMYYQCFCCSPTTDSEHSPTHSNVPDSLARLRESHQYTPTKVHCTCTCR